MRRLDSLQSPLLAFALYGNLGEKEEFLLTLCSVIEQQEISQEIMLPEFMRTVVADAGLQKETMIFLSSDSEDSFLQSAVRHAKAPYMLIGDRKISYVRDAFRDVVTILEETGADFIIEMVWHHDFGEPQPVLLSEAAFRSQQNGCEFNKFLRMDYLLANKFFRTEFLQDTDFTEDQSILSQLPQMYQVGYYQFRREYVVVYEGEEEYLDYVATRETERWLRMYVQDKSGGLKESCSIPDKKETLMKLMDYPVKKRVIESFGRYYPFCRGER